MVGVLAEAGVLEGSPDPAGGNRRCLALTTAGKETVEACAVLLKGRLVGLVANSGVDDESDADDTRRGFACPWRSGTRTARPGRLSMSAGSQLVLPCTTIKVEGRGSGGREPRR